MLNLWVDDIRLPPAKNYMWAKIYDKAVALIDEFSFDIISLDHDLGDYSGPDGREMTGYDVLMFIVEQKLANLLPIYTIVTVHSANPVAIDRMSGVIERYL